MPHFNPSGSALIAGAGVEKQQQPPRAAVPGCDWRPAGLGHEAEGWHGTARPVLQHSPVTHGTSHTLPAVAVKINLPKLFAEETSREPPHHVLQQGTGSWGAQGRLRTLPWGPGASEMQRACVTNIHGIHNIRTYGGKYSQSE